MSATDVVTMKLLPILGPATASINPRHGGTPASSASLTTHMQPCCSTKLLVKCAASLRACALYCVDSCSCRHGCRSRCSRGRENLYRRRRGGEGLAPGRVRNAPDELPEGLRVAGDAGDARIPQVQLRLVHRRHLCVSAPTECTSRQETRCCTGGPSGGEGEGGGGAVQKRPCHNHPQTTRLYARRLRPLGTITAAP